MALPWITKTTIAPPNAVSGTGYSFTATGSAPQWGDDSDATYATIVKRTGTAVSESNTNAYTMIGPYPDLYDGDPDARFAFWFKHTTDDPVPMRLGFARSAGANYRLRSPGWLDAPTPAYQTDGLEAPAGWTVAELVPEPGWTVQAVLSDLQNEQYFIEFTTGDHWPELPGTNIFTTSIQEVRVVIYQEAPPTAAPCRLFPREDGLGVGGGRIYPPPRSQQRSARRFGYY